MIRYVRKLMHLPRGILAAWNYDKALNLAATENYKEALIFSDKARAITQGSMIGPEILSGHCNWKLGNKAQSEKHLLKAGKAISRNARLNLSEKLYLKFYIIQHLPEELRSEVLTASEVEGFDIEQVDARWKRAFPVSALNPS